MNHTLLIILLSATAWSCLGVAYLRGKGVGPMDLWKLVRPEGADDLGPALSAALALSVFLWAITLWPLLALTGKPKRI